MQQEKPCLILVVDDEESVEAYINELLEHHDYDHVSFDNGEEALDFLSKHTDSVDLILSDIKMPCMDGIELAAKAAQIKPNIPIILISGYSDKLWEGMTAPNVKAVLDKQGRTFPATCPYNSLMSLTLRISLLVSGYSVPSCSAVPYVTLDMHRLIASSLSVVGFPHVIVPCSSSLPALLATACPSVCFIIIRDLRKK